MNNNDWKRVASTEPSMPTDLAAYDRIYYRLAGDINMYGPELAGNIAWGLPHNEGRVVQYCLVDGPAKGRYAHYFKPVQGLQQVDVYRVLQMFAVTDPCLQHAVKKLLVAGGRSAGKDISQDVQEAIDSLRRWQEMSAEDKARFGVAG